MIFETPFIAHLTIVARNIKLSNKKQLEVRKITAESFYKHLLAFEEDRNTYRGQYIHRYEV